MSTAIKSSFVDHSGLDGTGDAINGTEVDENPNVIAYVLDGTLATDLAGAGTIDFVMTDTRAGIRLIDLSNAAAAIHEGLVLEWDPGNGGNLTDNSSGIGIDFKLPDDADTQTVFGSLNVVCVDDAAASTDGEFSFRVTAAGTDDVEQMTLSAAAMVVTPPATITGLITATAGISSGANIVSDADSTDDLGTSSVRWANLFVDDITVTTDVSATTFTGALAATSTIADGVTATTQTASDNSTKVATTAYADAAGGTPFVSTDAHTWTADQTFNDSVKLTLGTGGDADLYYDGTDVVLNPKVVGSGIFSISGRTKIIGGASGASPSSVMDDLVIEHDGSDGGMSILSPNGNNSYIAFGDVADNDIGRLHYDHSDNHFDIVVNAAERMRIDSNGMVRIANTSGGGTHKLYVAASNAGDNIARFDNSSATNPYGVRFDMSGASPDDNSITFLNCVDSTTTRLFIYSDGDVANHDGTYGTISDVKFKQDIVDARSYWDDFKSLQYRKFRHKSDVEADENAPSRLGLIAQEVETVFPALVPESPDPLVPIVDVDGEPVLDKDGEPTYEAQTYHKWVKSSIIEGPIMASVVQELMARVEALEAV